MVISGNATINCDDYLGNDDSGNPSTSTVTMNGGTVNMIDDTTFNDDNPGTATVTINSGSWLGKDRINVSDNLDSTVHVTINGGQMVCRYLRLGEGGGDDIGQIRINLNGGLLQVNKSLSIKITDTKIIYTGGLLRIASADVNEADVQQMITDGTIVADGVYSIVTVGDYTVLNPQSLMQAKLPKPADGAKGAESVLLGTTLSWLAGDTAATHDVYFGTTNPPEFIGNQEATTYYQPIELGTTYYWQIDEVEADGTTKHTGDVWSFTTTTDLSTVSEIATQPNPADGSVGAALDATLSWWPGASAVSHDVYFGTTSPPALIGNQAEFSFDPGHLELETTYYWRVDAVAADGTVYTGDTWSFKTLLDIPITDPSLVAWWKLDEGAGVTAIDWSGYNHYGTLIGDPQWVAGFKGGALEFDGSDYVNVTGWKGIVADRTDPDNPSQRPFSIACWINTTSEARGSLVCWGSSDATGVGGQYQNFHVDGGRLRAEHGNGRFRGAARVDDGEWHHVAMTVAEGVNLEPPGTQLYVDGQKDTQGDDTVNQQNIWNITADADVVIGRSASRGDRYFTGLFDDIYVYDRVLRQAEIEAMVAPPEAWDPDPADGATEVAKTPTLSWKPGATAASHDVYFGDSSPPAFIGNQAETSYSPGTLDKGKTYYWRIDEVEADGTTKYEGGVWSFTVTTAGR